MVEVRNLSISYPLQNGGTVRALEGISARFPSGAVSAILGPSGCGKTSLIHAAAGLCMPLDGEILISGRPLTGVRPQTAVIFQDYGLLPWKTVQANAELPLALARLPRSIRRERAGKLLAEFGLAPFTKLYPRQLSGGMKQRLAIVRALAPEPDLLLMDEPFSSLDALSREDAQDLLLSIRKKRPLTIVMVTHSIEEAVYLADRVFVITGKNPGTLSATVDIPDGIHRGDSRFQECCASLRRLLRPSALPDVPSSALSERLTGGPGRG